MVYPRAGNLNVLLLNVFLNLKGKCVKNLYLNFSAFTLSLCLFGSASAQTNEVGNNLFVVEPLAQPIYVTDSGTRYWHCDGMIAPKLIEIILSELSLISKEENIPKPLPTPCHYKIGTFEFMGVSSTIYSVDFYISNESMRTCVEKDFCTNFRTMNFMVKNEKLHRQYMVTNIDKKLTRMACIDMTGKVVSSKAGC